jgi:hypothetical protein
MVTLFLADLALEYRSWPLSRMTGRSIKLRVAMPSLLFQLKIPDRSQTLFFCTGILPAAFFSFCFAE